MNWSFKQPTCSKRLMESWSTFLSKRSSSGDLNAAPSLDPYSAAKLLNNKRRNSFSCVRYFCYRRNRNEVKNVKEGHWCHLHNTKNSQKQTSRQFEHWVIKTRVLVLYVGCLNGQTKTGGRRNPSSRPPTLRLLLSESLWQQLLQVPSMNSPRLYAGHKEAVGSQLTWPRSSPSGDAL